MSLIASNAAISLPKIMLVFGVVVSLYFGVSTFRLAETYLLCDPDCVPESTTAFNIATASLLRICM
ncbi:hypothetical protein Fuma_00643 [Fuerstiella marisgermanici]|uniref:Uncharacterized protein n=1 Tax=Fuerstiella marisgermanici TaxID=1891926 RepID=A0A1P8WAH9_9PLAN|nr:hypothetical protein Fuma_00643 [Fuerstiella marisgermanici]